MSKVIQLAVLAETLGVANELAIELGRRGHGAEGRDLTVIQKIIRAELARAGINGGAGNAPDGFLTAAQAALHAQVKPSAIRSWIATGKLRAKKAGRQWRVKVDDLERAMSHGVEGQVPIDLKSQAANIINISRRRKEE